MVLKRTRTIRLGNGEHVGMRDIPVVHERDVGQIHCAVGEQLAGRIAPVAIVIRRFHALEHRIQIRFRAQDLLGSEAAVLVGATGTRERARVDHDRPALCAMHDLDGEVAGHARDGLRSLFNFRQLERTPLAVFVNGGALDGRLGLTGERPAHQGEVLLCRRFPLIACRHGSSFIVCGQPLQPACAVARRGRNLSFGCHISSSMGFDGCEEPPVR